MLSSRTSRRCGNGPSTRTYAQARALISNPSFTPRPVRSDHGRGASSRALLRKPWRRAAWNPSRSGRTSGRSASPFRSGTSLSGPRCATRCSQRYEPVSHLRPPSMGASILRPRRVRFPDRSRLPVFPSHRAVPGARRSTSPRTSSLPSQAKLTPRRSRTGSTPAGYPRSARSCSARRPPPVRRLQRLLLPLLLPPRRLPALNFRGLILRLWRRS